MTAKAWVVLASAASGLLWGAMVTFLLLDAHQRIPLGSGFLVSPVIGVLAGGVAILFRDFDMIGMAIVSLVSLYVAAALFGLGGGFVLAVAGVGRFSAALSMALSIPWAMTFGGFVLWMWPLAYFNHKFVGRLA